MARNGSWRLLQMGKFFSRLRRVRKKCRRSYKGADKANCAGMVQYPGAHQVFCALLLFPETGKIAIKIINHYGDEVLKVFEV